MKAFTRKNDGDSSDSVINTTDISGPSAPRILNLTCQSQDTIFVHWERPTEISHSLDYYYIFVNIGDRLYDNITLQASKEHLDTSVIFYLSFSNFNTDKPRFASQYSIKNMTTNAYYHIRIGASSKSLYTGRLIQGQLSETKAIHLHPNCDKAQMYMPHTTSELSAGVVAGVICAAFAFLMAITAFILWRFVAFIFNDLRFLDKKISPKT